LVRNSSAIAWLNALIVAVSGISVMPDQPAWGWRLFRIPPWAFVALRCPRSAVATIAIEGLPWSAPAAG
jgi:hypothetical protein